MPVKTVRCPCGSGKSYAGCCGQLHCGRALAETAEQLMRSRYSAYVLRLTNYLYDSTHPSKRSAQLKQEITAWAQQVEFFRLEIINRWQGTVRDKIGKVEFVAHYRQQGDARRLCELSRFRRFKGAWHYFDGDIAHYAEDRHLE